MKRIARSAAVAAPFLVVLSLASVGFAQSTDLDEPADLKPLDEASLAASLGSDDGTVKDVATVTSGMEVSLAGATGSGPSALPGKAATGNWLDEPIKG